MIKKLNICSIPLSESDEYDIWWILSMYSLLRVSLYKNSTPHFGTPKRRRIWCYSSHRRQWQLNMKSDIESHFLTSGPPISQYIQVHFMYWSKFQLASQVVQLKYRPYEAKRDGTPNKLPPSREIYVIWDL